MSQVVYGKSYAGIVMELKAKSLILQDALNGMERRNGGLSDFYGIGYSILKIQRVCITQRIELLTKSAYAAMLKLRSAEQLVRSGSVTIH